MVEQVHKSQSCSTVFSWKPEDFDLLLKSCDVDDEVIITLKYLKNKNWNILEAGCGLGRVVKYLHDKGFKNVTGVEINNESVSWLNNAFPDLNVAYGDVLALPYPKNSFDAVLSYGVVEHFPDGPAEPMKAMFDLLKPGGIAIVTVPVFNTIRRLSYALSLIDPRKKAFVRKIFNKKELSINKKRFSYYIDPQIGKFFEYRFTRQQFEKFCTDAGFEIVESTPIAHVDGLFHSFGKPLVNFKDWKFTMSKTGTLLNNVFKKIPSFHNHMHACVVRKPER